MLHSGYNGYSECGKLKLELKAKNGSREVTSQLRAYINGARAGFFPALKFAAIKDRKLVHVGGASRDQNRLFGAPHGVVFRCGDERHCLKGSRLR